jgi:hypothetical protein
MGSKKRKWGSERGKSAFCQPNLKMNHQEVPSK